MGQALGVAETKGQRQVKHNENKFAMKTLRPKAGEISKRSGAVDRSITRGGLLAEEREQGVLQTHIPIWQR